MKKRPTRATRRRIVQRSARPETTQGGPARPPRIPGVHVGHIGGARAAVEPIRAYWQARGAVFMHHSLEPVEPQSRLEEILARSHVVFHACAGASPTIVRDLERYCERTEKPLILLEENSMWALAKALAISLPVT